jgi:hypothetical protein
MYEGGTGATTDTGEIGLAYSLFHTHSSNPSDKTSDFRELTPLRFDTLGEAISAACNSIKSGNHALRIESPSGFLMERTDIEIECLRRKAAATDKTKTVGAGCAP